MAHFAQLDENNVVIQVIVVNNDVVNNLPFPESEPIGIEFCQSLYGSNTIWKQTSYNSNFRGLYAGKNYFYRENIDKFTLPQPYPSWTWDANSETWLSPIPYPDDGKIYFWDEATLSWVEIVVPASTNSEDLP